jgi:DNA-binding CsgD family transcriptional regulator
MGRKELLASWEPLMRSASVLFWMEDYERARGLLEHLLDRGRAFGLRAVLPVALDTLAAIDFRIGKWAAADARSTEALRLARALDQTPQVASCLTTLGGIAAARGDRPACEEYTYEALTLRDSYVFAGLWARTALASLALSEGKADEAIAEIERIIDDAAPLDPAISAWPLELVEAYVRAGRGDDARAVVAMLASRVAGAPRPGLRALVEHCRGLVAADGSYERHFEEALAWHARTSAPFFRARTELLYGMRLRRARRSAEAKLHLQLALAAFDRLGAQRWAEQARKELATGSRAAKGPESFREVLSPHEVEVALLVGRGATNKEAAAALFVSPKTIDYHLASIYRKLEVRSRTELAILIAQRS